MKEEGTSFIFLNLDFIFYLIYLFFKSIYNFFIPSGKEGEINFLNVWNNTNLENYSKFGEGIGSQYDGYSLFNPPHGAESFGGFFGWIDNFFNNPYCQDCPSFFDLFFKDLNAIIYFFIFLLIGAIFLLKKKHSFLDQKESILYDKVYIKSEEKGNERKSRWQEIIALLNSENPNDWKVSIINAENMLEEVLKENNFSGNGVGDMLKNADFSTISNAWEAHKIRNKISHDLDFVLTHKQAKSAIANFSKVFSEFYQ